MLVKITDKCSMGCTHCLSDCKPDGKHMPFETFKDVVEFNRKLNSDNNTMDISPILLSGGEPFEHPEIEKFIDYLIESYIQKRSIMMPTPRVIITTNGEYISKNTDIIKRLRSEVGNTAIQFQVSVDDRYYPTHIDESALKKFKNVIICHGITSIYPQGRALENNIPYSRKSSSCYNVRALAKQFGATDSALSTIFKFMIMKGHITCCPHIDIDGNIKVGESRLCPVCSNIYKTDEEIVRDIINFKCHQCDFINDRLPPEYRRFVE